MVVAVSFLDFREPVEIWLHERVVLEMVLASFYSKQASRHVVIARGMTRT